jgi:hypothetical protein
MQTTTTRAVLAIETAVVPNDLTAPRVHGHHGTCSPLDALPSLAIRREAMVDDVEFWQQLPETVRALAYRVLNIEGIE